MPERGNWRWLNSQTANDYQAYQNAASFVPQLATQVMQDLDPQPGERILDIGCGDGVLTRQIAARCGSVIGLDSSPSFIRTAKATASPKFLNVEFYEADCRRLGMNAMQGDALKIGGFDKVFSNAAM